ncbi:helix-turn-helix domain-containing protein [Edwardsiella tarda]|uniref:transcriptional regulator n=1 Tax=Edwardsiella tarda TaxID=636 RepID=UPI000D51EDF7|nr:helix-turn-helix domain-containing protein [Edwardsiella tarda]UCQ52888.1 helix-turn-helix domain-containing protein [Edwardsiella tarda]
MKHEAVQKAIEIAGSQMALAKRCGKAQSTICDWLNGKKRISPQNVPILVAATNGEVGAHEFRPDLPEIFPRPANNQEHVEHGSHYTDGNENQ